MNTSLTITQGFIAMGLSAVIIYATRALPFLIFNKKKPPMIVRFIEKYTPSLIIAVLIVCCFKDVSFSKLSLSVPYITATVSVVILHLKFKNTLISIFVPTIIFMILSRI